MRIGSHDIRERALLIAEIGNNHEGDVGLAEELIGLAAEAGADAVKFQAIIPELLVAPDQTERLAQLRRYALESSDFERLERVAAEVGVTFLTTPFSPESVPLIAEICPAIKVASGDNDNPLLLEPIARTGLPVILSTGMQDASQVEAAISILESVWAADGLEPGLALLHCVSAYPTPSSDANLRVIRSLETLGRPVGFSDHTIGIDAAVAAVAVGAVIIEKHFTDRHDRSDFRDHALSADKTEFKELVLRVRETERLLGDGRKRVMPSEQVGMTAARRSLHSARPLTAGEVIGADDVIALRPGTGIPVSQRSAVIGRMASRDLPALHRLRLTDLN